MPEIRGRIGKAGTQARPFRRSGRACSNSSTPKNLQHPRRARYQLPGPLPAHQDPPTDPRLRPGKAGRRCRSLPASTRRWKTIVPITRAITMTASTATHRRCAIPIRSSSSFPASACCPLPATRRRLASPSEFYVNAINVMRGASTVSEYQGLPEQEAFDIEYWLLGRGEAAAHAEAEEPCRHRWPSSPAEPAASAARRRPGWWARAPAWCLPISISRHSRGDGGRFREEATARMRCAA